MTITWPEPFPGVHWIDREEEEAVLEVLRGGSLFRYFGKSPPQFVAQLEATAREFYGVKHALAVNSGTGALMTAMIAMGIGPGSEVIVPSFFWVATVGAVVQANAVPVLCEVDDSLTMDPRDLERKITPKTRLIVPVHMAGAPSDMDAIGAIAERHGILVLEDCAQANGGEFHGRKLGTFGRLGMFSLQLNKNATAGEGGLLVTDDAALYERCVSAHDLGIPWVGAAPCETIPQSVTWGVGRRMSELCGAVASVQMRKLPQIVARMRASKQRIKSLLRHVPGIQFRRLNDEQGDSGPFLILLLQDEPQAIRAAQRISEAGLGGTCRLADYGLHIYSNVPQLVQQVPLSPAGNPWRLPQNQGSVRGYAKGTCPRSDALFARSILIPIPSRLTVSQEEQAAAVIEAAVA
jgi:8-amino-3,8-dideoxy-alpha-D-manno-octulosonate transaminase